MLNADSHAQLTENKTTTAKFYVNINELLQVTYTAFSLHIFVYIYQYLPSLGIEPTT